MPAVYGTDADDDLNYGNPPSGWTIYGGDGNDLLNTGGNDDYLYGGAGNDSLWGGTQFNILDGGEGIDTLYVIGDPNDGSWWGTNTWDLSISGPQFNPDYYPPTGQVFTLVSIENILIKSGGNNTFTGNDVANILSFWDGNDTGYGRSGDDTLLGYAGHDSLAGEQGNDVIRGGDGNDSLFGGAGNDQLFGEVGNDHIQEAAGENLIYGGAGIDGIGGGSGSDTIYGDGDSDSLSGGAGNDLLVGGDGHDQLWGNSGDDDLNGGDGNDSLYGGDGFDHRDNAENGTLHGATGNDEIYGRAGNDQLFGGDGSDLIMSGSGVDEIDGGAGNDTGAWEFALSEAQIHRTPDGVVVEYGDSITTIENVEIFQFTDEILSFEEILRLADPMNATPTGEVQILGDIRVGSTVYVDVSDVQDADGFGSFIGFMWYRNGEYLGGGGDGTGNPEATGYLLGSEHYGELISVSYTFIDGLGNEETVFSDSFRVAPPPNSAPDGLITIVGNARQGQVLEADVAAIEDADGIDPETVAFQWLRNGVPITGETASSYTLTAADAGRNISVRYSYIDGYGTEEAVTSAARLVASNSPAIIITADDTMTGEDSGSTSLTVRLATAPVYPVTITFAVSDSSEARLEASSLTFTAANWSVAQTLTIYGVDDYDDDGDVAFNLTGTLTTDDLSYTRVVMPTISLTNEDDGLDRDQQIYGDNEINYLSGNNGNDRIYGEGNLDELRGGRGNDRLYGDQDDDRLYGDEGVDWLYGGYDDDRLFGGEGDDELYGEAGADTLSGGDGNDLIDGGTGADRMSGNNGNDTYYVDSANDVVIDGGLATDVDTVILLASITYTLSNTVENASLDDSSGDAGLTGNALRNLLEGNDGDNALTGGGGADTLSGAEGNDTLYSGDGNDTVDGGAGSDLIVGGNGAGNDLYRGGAGVDTIRYSSATAGIVVNLDTGTARSTTGADAGIGRDRLSSIENVIGGRFNDVLTGNGSANQLTADAGRDRLEGLAGADRLIGGAGADSLIGGTGKDRLTGDAGADVFIFDKTSETGATSTKRDVITDFQQGDDLIDLSGIDANTNVRGNQGFSFIGADGFSGAAGQLRFAGGIASGDVNGDRVADFTIAVTGLRSMTEGDFVL